MSSAADLSSQWGVPYRDIRYTAPHIWHVSVTDGRNSKIINPLRTELLYGWRFTASQFAKPLEVHDQRLFFW
jgi:hypothetical protein